MKNNGERFLPNQTGVIRLEHLNRYFFVINQFDLSDKVVLDIASGEGYGSDLMASRAKYVYGVDISIETIEHAKKTYKRDNITFKQGKADSIPLIDNSIDVVVSFETIEHHDKHVEMINEIKRVLKEDGILIISSPDKLYSEKHNHINHFHIKELYLQEFKRLLNDNFRNTWYFHQKILLGSCIFLNGGFQQYQEPILINKNDKSISLEPVYNIAIATDKEKFSINSPIIFYTENERIITEDDLLEEFHKGQENVYNSYPYKLGHFLILPVKKLIMILNIIIKKLK